MVGSRGQNSVDFKKDQKKKKKDFKQETAF